MAQETPEITRLLNLAAAGDTRASREVYPHLCQELRQVAISMRRRLPAGETLQVTALVNEAYVRLQDGESGAWKARSHFFFAAARAMRNVLIDEIRRKKSAKKGGNLEQVTLGEIAIPEGLPPEDLLTLDEILGRLEVEDPLGYDVTILRFFGGLGVREIASVTGVSVSSIERKWRFLRVWLSEQIKSKST